MMRTSLSALAIAAAALAASPASAQSYAPDAPVCLQVYGPLSYTECRYSSIPQCQASASGRAAQCLVNPYFAGPQERPPRRARRSG